MVVGPAQHIRAHITYGGMDGDTTDGWVGFMLGACAMCPQSCCSSCFLGIVAGPFAHYVPDVIETIEYGKRASKESRPPCMWDWEQLQDAVLVAIHSWAEEHIIAVVDGVLSCGGACVGSYE